MAKQIDLADLTPRRKKNLALKLLKGTRARIEKPGGWTKGTYFSASGGCCLLGGIALEAQGIGIAEVEKYSYGDEVVFPGATLMKLQHHSVATEMFGTMSDIRARTGFTSVSEFNDSTTKQKVLKYLDERIAALEGKK